MHATGVGKLLLLNYSEAQFEALEKKFGLTKYTDNTITTLEELKREITQVMKQGYALDNEECEEGVKCIAVPVRNYTGEVTAGISLSAPVTRLDKVRTEQIISYLKNVSAEASKELGWTDKI